MVEVLAIKFDDMLFLFYFLSADRANLNCFVVFALFVAFSLSYSAKIFLAPALNLVERLFVFWFLMEDSNVLAEPLLCSLLSDILGCGLASLLKVERKTAARSSSRHRSLQLKHGAEHGWLGAWLRKSMLALYSVYPVARSIAC